MSITVIVPSLLFSLQRLFFSFSIVCNAWYCKQRLTNKSGPVHFGSVGVLSTILHPNNRNRKGGLMNN